MWKYCPSILVALAGVICVAPLFATVCGPQSAIPGGVCLPAHENAPALTGSCVLVDGSCVSFDCSSTSFGVAVEGVCGVGDASSEIPQGCLKNSGTVNVTVNEYSARCSGPDGCRCVWEETGNTNQVEVCTCRDL